VDGIDEANAKRIGQKYGETKSNTYGQIKAAVVCGNAGGRFPANLVLDEEAGAMLGSPSRYFYCAKASRAERDRGCEDLPVVAQSPLGDYPNDPGKSGVLSPKRNFHPTVKPLSLVTYLAKLILPPNHPSGIIVPYAGSGSEMIGAIGAGWDEVTGIEREAEYVAIARSRLAAVRNSSP
jgi:site-specific DNA-methyltransferase (adenine-specific)